MKILQVSTLQHNPGDDFIRFGQQHLLRRLGLDANFVVVHKHDPRTLFSGYTRRDRTPHRLVAPVLYRLHAAVTRAPNMLDTADLVAFAGTPFIWRQNTRLLRSTSANAEWVAPIWRRLMRELLHIPVINLAAGSSLNVDQRDDDVAADPKVATFLRDAVTRSAVTTARDQRTALILASLGHEVPVLACTSLWAADGAEVESEAPEYVAVNVMRRGVHSSRGKSTDERGWKDVITRVVGWLSERHRVRLICHSPDELDVAHTWFPQHDAFYSRDAVEVLGAYGRAFYTVSNRVHGAGGAASFGRPALGIGGDSRIELLREFGLPTLDVATATADSIISECERIEADWDTITRDLSSLAAHQERRYVELLRVVAGEGS
jgi:hypothetical protein